MTHPPVSQLSVLLRKQLHQLATAQTVEVSLDSLDFVGRKLSLGRSEK